MSEAKKGFKARVESEMAAAGGDNLSELKAAFSQEERAIEHDIDHTVHSFSATVDVAYNVRSNSPTTHKRFHLTLFLCVRSSCPSERARHLTTRRVGAPRARCAKARGMNCSWEV